MASPSAPTALACTTTWWRGGLSALLLVLLADGVLTGVVNSAHFVHFLLYLPGFFLFGHHRPLRWRRKSSWLAGILAAGALTFGLDELQAQWSGSRGFDGQFWIPIVAFAVVPLCFQALRLIRRQKAVLIAPTPVAEQARRAASATLWPRIEFVNGASVPSAWTDVGVVRCEGSQFINPRGMVQGPSWRLPLHPEGPHEGMGRVVKRLIDLILVLLAAPLALPLCLVIAAWMRCTGRGPSFYWQTRITAGDKVFTIHKLRTMVLDAEPGGTPVWPEEADPRITPLGVFLRRYWLDELPQLWDVLVGDMSLVGPRPERPAFVQAFSKQWPNYPLRHQVKGGMTGLAQVCGLVGNTPISRRLRHDLAYVRLWSPCLDLWILITTLCKAARRPRQTPAP